MRLSGFTRVLAGYINHHKSLFAQYPFPVLMSSLCLILYNRLRSSAYAFPFSCMYEG